MSKYPDISHHHPVTDWNAVNKNCPFLISKATEGTTYIDPTLDSFIYGCEEHGIPYWLYSYLKNGNEVKQAEFLVNTCKNKVGKYFVGYILDVEEDNSAPNVKAALDYLNGIGCKTMIYTMYSDYPAYRNIVSGLPSNCAWWEARYGQNSGEYSSKYPCHSGVDLHQFTSNGACSGISGRCDLNRIVRKGEEWFMTPEGAKEEKQEENNSGSDATVNVSLNVLKYGSKGQNVKAAQILLTGRGYGCGKADGIFGSNTLEAVKKFQKASGLVVDCVVGANTWAALLA